MTLSVSDECRACLITLQEVISILSKPDHNDGGVKLAHVCEHLDRFSLFIGNIGALHRPQSSLSIESRLQEANDVLIHILGLLADLKEVAVGLLEIVSSKREGMISIDDEAEEENGEESSEVNELLEEISETITRLFRISILIRQAAPTDLFAKALSRDRYRFSDQFDIAHVGEKYRKLATKDYVWLRQRLGRAITQRRHYLSYIQDHHEKLGGMLSHHDKADSSAARSQAPVVKQPLASKLVLDTASRPSFFTKATTVAAERITPQLLGARESESGDDARSYTTISRSIDGDHESSTTVRIPKLEDLRIGNKQEFECPFCFRIKKFKSERIWRKHVFSDLRPYVCTFPDCDAPYFGDINKWFQHEMTFHRVVYKCFLCPNKVYHKEKNYISHLNQEHANMLDVGGEQQGRDLARKPLAQIPASDCPCCSDWVDRLKERIIQTSRLASNELLVVTPTVFKRHLAGHLEQLALFAVPVGAATDDDQDSNAAMEEGESKRTDASQLSTLTFASLPDDLVGAVSETEVALSKSEVPHADIQVIEFETKAKSVRVAEQLLRELVQQQEKVLGAEDVKTLDSKYRLALTLHEQEEYAEAEQLLRELVQQQEKVLGAGHVDTLGSKELLQKVVLAKVVSSRLSDFFTNGSKRQTAYTDSEIQQASLMLSQVNLQWSKVPRTYMVLRIIGCLDLLDTFIDMGVSDHWLPFTERSLPPCLRPSKRSQFVSAQNLVMTKSMDLEKGKGGQHCYFRQDEPLPLEMKGILGSGRFGQVNRVLSTISFREYALKRVSRSAIFSGQTEEDNQQRAECVKQFIAEIGALKRLKHRHIVEIVGSYTDPKYMGLIMSPVADMNLSAYLARANTASYRELRTFFGCLARALAFLHEQGIRHKDIKPSNILVHGGNVLFTDFGLAFDFTDKEGSTTVSMVNGMTPRYCAPEVAGYEPRNTSSDIWSLGVVFLEMTAVLKGRTVAYMYDFLKEHGSRQTYVRTNPTGTDALITGLKDTGSPTDNSALVWVQDMIMLPRQLRPTAASLIASITSAGQKGDGNEAFCGICCALPDDFISDFDELEIANAR